MAHPKDADLKKLIDAVAYAVHRLEIAVANKQAYRVGDQPTLQYTTAHVEALQWHMARLEAIGN